MLSLKASIIDASTAAAGMLFQSRKVDETNNCWWHSNLEKEPGAGGHVL
jgi:hypothetical protein